jgi:hypothetical protein
MGDTALNAWMTVKTLTFPDSATELTVCGHDLDPAFWCPNRDFTACAGFVLSCSGGRWDGVKTDTTWLVTASGLAGDDLMPNAANSDSYAVASTSAFAPAVTGEKIWSSRDDEAACFTKIISDNGNNNGGGNAASLAIIIPVVVAAVLLLAAVLFLVCKRVVAARQHRRESMPAIAADEAEA